jgi:oxepin-CoA hydrolase/3-oxo-5,6-dehydrosuberyl-CoA semialdehyde dehydrogenase
MPRYFDDLQERETWLSAERTITDADLRQFAALTGDDNALHLDDAAARERGYPQRIAHGAFVFAAAVGLLQDEPARRLDVMAFHGVQRLQFKKPVFPGDVIRVRQTIQSLRRVDDGSGIMEATEEVVNQHGVVTTTFTARFLIRRHQSPGR